MERQGEDVKVTETEASAGVKHHNVWIVLAVSLALIIIIFAVITGTGMLSR